ncbi:hypothetical protein DACRYDRAFT_25162 [Dacryopinax primogenitus]|uniref:IPT/TIG domain-containing protein n=1 Tax=Dacryopinax primogenitus (strain DJM 731) TaxID=1858805 RepID=M5FR80_DACPD|nr:uncharacterized protein DACRYDRAFT_25162 [Dacryopinax primogenitus]EJT97404.1 hypothetical protein DACRYDRAFT_25162 [Dacryopinax primogenitus]
MTESAVSRPRSPSPPTASSHSSPSTSDYPSDPNMNGRVSQPFANWHLSTSLPDLKPPEQSLLLEDVLKEDAFSSTTDHATSGPIHVDFGTPSLQLYPFAATHGQDTVSQQLVSFHSLGSQSPTTFSPLETLLKQEPPTEAQMPGLIYPVGQEGSPTDYSTSYFYSTSHPQTPASSSESPQPATATVESQHDAKATEIVYPPPSITGLKIGLPTIPSFGAKSRVETQIKVVLQLAMPDGDPLAGRRVGTWKWIRLEKGAALRRRPRNAAKNMPEPKPAEVLYLVATVHPASQPNLTAFRCVSCHQREVKRTARKLALRVRRPPSPSPSLDHGKPKLRENSEEELDDKRMVIFNCADLQELRDGEVSLPTRLVCYCRHHREKVGFIVVFKLFAEGGRLVAEGTSPPIMITDDHKSRNPTDIETPATRVDILGQVSGPEEVIPKRRRVIDDGAESQQERRPRKKNRSAASTPPMLSERPSPSQGPLPLPLSPLSTSAISGNSDLPSNLPSYPQTIPGIFQFPHAISGTVPVPQTVIQNRPKILRLIPPTGPVAGGIEVTLLGQAFNLTTAPVFGNVAATSWTPYGENAIVCILPPSPCPGPVRVTLQGVEPVLGEEPSIFCYEDHSDKALMELALQVVGLKMNGRIDNARDVAMQIMVSGRSMGPGNPSTSQAGGMPYGQSMYAATRFLGSQASQAAGHDFQSTVMALMRLLEAPFPSNGANEAYLCRTGPTGLTLLHLAVILNFHRLCGQLLSLGSDPNVRDVNGYTALHFAALHGRVRCTRLLVDAGADVNIVHGLGESAADVARGHDEVDVLEICEEYGFDHPDNFDGVDADESADDALSDASYGMPSGDDMVSEDDDVAFSINPPSSGRNVSSPVASPSLSCSTDDLEELPPLPDDSDADLMEPGEQGTNAAPPPYSYWPSTLVDYSAALLQKALLQLHNPPYPASWEKMPSVVPTLPWEKMAQQLNLSAMPLIFHVGVPSWPPALTWPGTTQAFDGEKTTSTLGNINSPSAWWQRPEAGQGRKLAAGMRGAPPLSGALQAPAPDVVAPPSRGARRIRYDEVDVTDGELNSYAYQASMDGRRTHKSDRMLVVFWIPVLILFLRWLLSSHCRTHTRCYKEVPAC